MNFETASINFGTMDKAAEAPAVSEKHNKEAVEVELLNCVSEL